MPEVVEVGLTALWLDDKIKNRKITKVNVVKGRYTKKPIKGLTEFNKALPVVINKVDSKGKFMWFECQSKDTIFYILNRFGLEGEWGFDEYDHSNVHFTIKDDTKNKERILYFTDPRNFGTITITKDKKVLDKELEDLGDDFLKTSFTNSDFYDRIKKLLLDKSGKVNKRREKREIIKVLMDQKAKTGLGSGLGNYLAVEALYNARISPYKTIGDIYEDRSLSDKLAEGIKKAVLLSYRTADVGYLEHLPDSMSKFILEIREEIKKNDNSKYNYHKDFKTGKGKFKFNVYRQKKDPEGNLISGDKIISGRTTYWSPEVQH